MKRLLGIFYLVLGLSLCVFSFVLVLHEPQDKHSPLIYRNTMNAFRFKAILNQRLGEHSNLMLNI